MKPASFRYCTRILFTCLLGFLAACDQKEPEPKSIDEAVNQIIFPYIAFGSNVGVAVGIISKGQKRFYSFGEKEIGKRDAITAQSIFEIASVTKTFTALALADMHLKGELNLDDPAENYLPSTVKMPSRNGKKITLRQLANHTSGLPGQPTNMDEDAFNPYKDYTEQKMFDFLNGHTLPRDPGAEYQYSNLGYGILGYIIGLKNNTSYGSVIATRITQPLGMANTAVELNQEQKTQVIQGHNGSKKVDPWAPYQQNVTQGGGSLYSNMDDLLIFLAANMDQTTTPLRDAMLLTQQINTNYPFSSLDWRSDGIGLAWGEFIVNGEKIICKSGGNGGFTSFIGFNKSQNTGVVILSNSSMNPDAFPTQMGFEILTELKRLQK